MELITLKTNAATATISLYGAQVMSFIPNGQPDALWQTSPEHLTTALSNGKALRGGIPVCWPWFNAHPTVSGAPSHGLGRTQTWNLLDHTNSPEQSTATLTLMLDGSHPAWPHKTSGELVVTLTDTLTVSLTTTNESQQPFKLQQALHTYLNVADVSNIELGGITGLKRRHVTSGTHLPNVPEDFRITTETEDLISPVITPITLEDSKLNRTITIQNIGSDETVIWNPWAEKAAKLDMPIGSYRHMLCLEAANIDNALTLAPGHSHTLTTVISSETH